MEVYIIAGSIGIYILYRYFKSRSIPSISIAEVKQKLTGKSFLVVDVRTREEWNGGHIKPAINIPLHELNSRLNELESHKEKELAIVCRSGNRSASATSVLIKNGFNAKNVTGGMMNWS